MTPAARLAGGTLVLTVYAWVLNPMPASVSSADHRADADVEQWLALSNDAYAAGRYADALAPTSSLVARYPLQQAYAERLARIFGQLNRPADEAGAWERFVDLFGGEATPAHGHLMPAQNLADRLSRNAELLAQFVDRRPGLIALDELLYLVVVELSCPTGLSVLALCTGWPCGVR